MHIPEVGAKIRLITTFVRNVVMRNHKVIFLHIPKTAGTSLREIVEEEYGKDNCLYLYYPPPYDEATLQEINLQLPKVKVLYGHVWFPIHELFNVKAKYVAFLRHPVDRVISFYKHIACDPESRFYESIQNGMSLNDMLQQEVSIQTNNYMTRLLSNCWQADDKENTQFVDMALENIKNHFYYVGVVEKFDESLERLAKKLRWRTNCEIPYVNASMYEKPLEIDSETLALIEKYNRLDLQLYETIKNSF